MRTRRKRLLLTLAAGLPVGALAARAWRAYQRDLELARNRILALGRDIETSVGPLEFAVTGDGPAILISHGLFGGFDQGLFIASALAGPFQWVAPSRFGYLYTPLPQDASPAAQARAHAALLDALELERVAVVGVSTGALSALEFALAYPERCAALVLISPAAFAGEGLPFDPSPGRAVANPLLGSDFALWAGLKLGWPALVERFLAPGASSRMTAGEWERLAEFAQTMLPLAWRRAGTLNDVAFATLLSPGAAEQVRAPTLVIAADDDPLRSLPGARNLAERIPGARLVELGVGGHVLLGDGDRGWAEVIEFLHQQVRSDVSGSTVH